MHVIASDRQVRYICMHDLQQYPEKRCLSSHFGKIKQFYFCKGKGSKGTV